MSTLEQTKLALALKESDNGRNKRTYQLNNHNAFGKFQVTAPTFAGMQKNGDIPADWQHTNPKHADAAGEKLIEQLHTQYGGDLTKVAAAFYAGPKAVKGDKIINYRDLKNPGNPDVLQYVQAVQKLAGDYTDVEMQDDAEEADTKQVSLPAEDLMNTPMPARYDRQVFAKGKQPKVTEVTPAVETPLVKTPLLNEVQSQAAVQEARKKEIDDTSFLDVARSSFTYGTFAGAGMRAAIDAAVEPEFKPDPAYKPDPEVFAGRTGEEQQELMEAVSAQHAQRILAKQDDRRQAEDVMSRRGLGMQLAAGFVAAAPEAIVTGLGTARGLYTIGKGSMQLAAQGRTAASLASMAAENVGAGLVVTAGQDYLDGHVSAKDYAIGALMDLSLGFIGAPLHIRMSADAKAHGTHFSNEAMRGIAEIDAELEAARSRAGEGVPKQAVQAEAARAEAEAVQTVQESATKVDPSRKLVSDEDNGAVFYGESKDTPAPDEPATETGLTFKGDMVGVHGSTTPLNKLVDPADVNPDIRYDGDGGIFGSGFYTAEDGFWFMGDSMRMPQFTYATDVKSTFDNALVISPETYSRVVDILDEVNAKADPNSWVQLNEQLAGLGYDGVIVRGFPQEIDPADPNYPKYQDLLQNQIVTFDPKKAEVLGENSVITPFTNRIREAADAVAAKEQELGLDKGDAYRMLSRFDLSTEAAQHRAAHADRVKLYEESGLKELVYKERDAIKAIKGMATKSAFVSSAYTDGRFQTEAAMRAERMAEEAAPMSKINEQPDNARIVDYVPNTAPAHVKAAAGAALDMATSLLPKHVRVGVVYLPGQGVAGLASVDGPVVRIGLSDIGTAGGKGVEVGIHEVGHAVNAYYLPNYVNKAAIIADYHKFINTVKSGDLDTATKMRWASPYKGKQIDPTSAYDLDFDEWLTEQATKHIRDKAVAGDSKGLRSELVKTLRTWVDKVMQLFTKAKDKGYLPAERSVADFIDAVSKGEVQPVKFARPVTAKASMADSANAGRAAVMNDPIARKYGIDLLPMGTPAEQARAKTILALYKRADKYPKPDEKRLNSLLKNTVFADSTGTLLRSENPIMRMLASELLESASGATKRQATAAIGKYITERKMLGNSLQVLEGHYKMWRNEHGGHIGKDLFDGKDWANFNKQVAIHIESKGQANSHPAVRAAAEELEKAYDRIRLEQVEAKTLGYKGLPETSVGYMPHKMSPEALRNLSVEQARVLHSSLTDQFTSIEGFDPTFADRLASKYIDVVRRRGVGGYHGSIGDGAADLSVMEDALDSLNLTKQESDAMKQRMRSGSAGYTKGRLKLDLLREHALADGSTFRLIDVFETDQRALLRQQAGRASGEVALARHGILGKPGLQLMREAAELGDAGSKAQPKEFEAFDQVSAEFLNEPFGNHNNRLLDRVMQANSLARLGGMFFPQLGEFTNGVAHLGMAHAFAAVPGLRRLRAEAKALARGEKVDNPILGSIETVSGAEFGTDTYKFSFPFQEPDKVYQTYGQDSLTSVDRLLRGGLHVQAKLSFWRSLHAAQQRGMAEQIVRKALRYMRDGTDDVALADMGFTPELREKLSAELPNVATWGPDNQLESLDLTKATDLTAVEDFVQAVHRGTNQIIQGTFIGEQGKWAHDGLLRFMTQFRTFSITSVEKQWTRQMNNHGAVKGWGIMVGTMMMAAPIYIARTVMNSVGRDDQEEYLNKMLAPAMIARASMNYVAMTGLAGDFADAFTAVTGTGEVTGARSGAATGFVGTVVAPGAGWVDDVWKGLQNTKDGTDPSELAKTLPFANLPLLSLPVRMLAP